MHQSYIIDYTKVKQLKYIIFKKILSDFCFFFGFFIDFFPSFPYNGTYERTINPHVLLKRVYNHFPY